MKYAYRRMSVLLVDSTSVAVDAMEGHLEGLQFHRIWSAKTTDEAMQVLRERAVGLAASGLAACLVRPDGLFFVLPLLAAFLWLQSGQRARVLGRGRNGAAHGER